MAKGSTIFLSFVFLVSGIGAYRSKEGLVSRAEKEANRVELNEGEEIEGNGIAMLEDSEVEENMMDSAESTDFCASSRCDGYTDADAASEKQLKFRFPHKGLNVEPMRRSDVAKELGYEGYHYGSLESCRPVTNMFSYSRDWATHMQTSMREGTWPNSPADLKYRCAERCRLQIFNEKKVQINKNREPEVWVERDGNSGDFLSKIPFIGWTPDTCTAGNALQVHWWKQHVKASRESDYPRLMKDTEGLPAFPTLSENNALSWVLEEQFSKKFCALTKEQKISVVRRVTKHRPDPARYGKYYNQVMLMLKARNYFPKGFPIYCWSDGWTSKDAEGVSKDD